MTVVETRSLQTRIEDPKTKDVQYAVNQLRKAESRVQRILRDRMEKSRRWVAYEKQLRAAFVQEKAQHEEDMNKLETDLQEAQKGHLQAKELLGRIAYGLASSLDDIITGAKEQDDWDMLTSSAPGTYVADNPIQHARVLMSKEAPLVPSVQGPGNPFGVAPLGQSVGSLQGLSHTAAGGPTPEELAVLRKFLGAGGAGLPIVPAAGTPPGLGTPLQGQAVSSAEKPQGEPTGEPTSSQPSALPAAAPGRAQCDQQAQSGYMALSPGPGKDRPTPYPVTSPSSVHTRLDLPVPGGDRAQTGLHPCQRGSGQARVPTYVEPPREPVKEATKSAPQKPVAGGPTLEEKLEQKRAQELGKVLQPFYQKPQDGEQCADAGERQSAAGLVDDDPDLSGDAQLPQGDITDLE